jgi:hypothetical protein
MDGRGSRLAARFRQAVDDREALRRQAEESARAAAEDARSARQRLLADIEQIARDIGSIDVSRPSGALQLRLKGRVLGFAAAKGDGDRIDVTVDLPSDGEHWLYRQQELGARWVYAHKRGVRDDRVPLFDQGLEELLVRGLGLPPPTPEASPAPEPLSKKL